MSQFRLGAGNGEGQLTTENNHATCRLFPLFRLLGAPKQEKSQPENSPSRSSGAPKQRSCVTTARGLHAGAEASLQDAAAARATRSLFWQNCSLQLRKAQQTHTQPPSAGPRATASACRPAFPLPQSSAERRIAVGTDPLGVTVTASHSSHRSWTRLPAPRRERWGVPGLSVARLFRRRRLVGRPAFSTRIAPWAARGYGARLYAAGLSPARRYGISRSRGLYSERGRSWGGLPRIRFAGGRRPRRGAGSARRRVGAAERCSAGMARVRPGSSQREAASASETARPVRWAQRSVLPGLKVNFLVWEFTAV